MDLRFLLASNSTDANQLVISMLQRMAFTIDELEHNLTTLQEQNDTYLRLFEKIGKTSYIKYSDAIGLHSLNLSAYVYEDADDFWTLCDLLHAKKEDQ